MELLKAAADLHSDYICIYSQYKKLMTEFLSMKNNDLQPSQKAYIYKCQKQIDEMVRNYKIFIRQVELLEEKYFTCSSDELSDKIEKMTTTFIAYNQRTDLMSEQCSFCFSLLGYEEEEEEEVD